MKGYWMNNNEECAAYFRSRPESRRCLQALRAKWESYGRAAGYITLSDASEAERRLLGGILGKNFAGGLRNSRGQEELLQSGFGACEGKRLSVISF